MKFAISILKTSITFLVITPILCLVFHYYTHKTDFALTIMALFFAVAGTLLSLLLIRNNDMAKTYFWISFISFLLVFAIPALVAVIDLVLLLLCLPYLT